jgi:HlyD family secretion protein
MPSRAVTTVVKSVRTLLEVGTAAGLSDSQLLERYRLRRDDAAEAAFSSLVERHGPMVLRVCRGVLHDEHDAEDAFQATFLILARKAGAIRNRDSVASWLFGVARHVAGRCRAQRQRRAFHEEQGGTMGQSEARSSDLPHELVPEVQEEVDRLPERYRSAIVLCYIEGLSQDEAASQLRLPASTVRVRLMRARARMRKRLIRRGLAPALLAGLSASRAEAAIPASLVDKTIKAAIHIAVGRAAGVSAPVAAIVEGVIKAMFFTKLKLGAALLAALTLASVLMIASMAVRAQNNDGHKNAPRPTAAPKSKPTGDGPEVSVMTVGRSRLERTISGSGNVIAAQSADLYPRISGYVSSVRVDIGARVKRGDLVAELFDPELTAAVDKARAEVERAAARVKKAEASIRVSEAATAAQEARVQVVSSALEQAESKARGLKEPLDRLTELAKKREASQRMVEVGANDYALAQAGANTARSQLLAAKAVIAETRAKTEEARADLAEAMGDLRIAKTGRQNAEIVLEYTRLRSPFDGVVTRRNYHPGELVRLPNAGGVSPIVTIVDTNRMRFVVNVPEQDAPLLDEGDQAKVRIEGLGFPTVYQGKIARTAYAVDPNSGSVRAEIDLTNSDGRFRPGQFGTATIVLIRKENVLTIPRSAIVEQDADGAPACYRVVAGRAVRSRLHVGDGDGIHSEVLEGLKEGDVVVTRPDPGLIDGQAITIKSDGQNPAAR